MVKELQNYQPLIETNPEADPDELRNKIQENSYVFFRGLIPAEKVLSIRRAVCEICLEAGWLDSNFDLMEGIIGPNVKPTQEGNPDYAAVYRKVLNLASFQQLPTHPKLLKIAGALLEINSGDCEEILVHPRRIGRLTFPNNEGATTPPHQDFYHVRGSVNTFSCWMPLGDCPTVLGGLAILAGSHRGGFVEQIVEFPKAIGGSGISQDKIQGTWHTTDFRMGDALFFHSYTIHKALPNLTSNRIRISTDNRYQLKKDKIDPGALLQHIVAT